MTVPLTPLWYIGWGLVHAWQEFQRDKHKFPEAWRKFD
jgi:hypothetical protein